MRKIVLAMIILVTVLCPTMTYAKEKSNVLIAVNDQLIEFTEGNGESIRNVTYAPLREFAQALGVTVTWDKEKKLISLEKEEKKIYLNIKDKSMIEEGKEKIPYDMVEEDGTTFIPARTLAEYFEYVVRYIKEDRVLRVIDSSATLSDKEFSQKYQEAILRHNAKVVYLTFDDGPNDYTLEILKLLAKYDMKATFFMLNDRMKIRPEVVEKVLEEGHAIGLHGVSHEKDIFYTGLNTPLNEMNKANATLEEITGKRSALVRMPYGSVPYLTNGQYNSLVNYGYRIWDWHVDSRDWASKEPNKPYHSVVKQLQETNEEAPVILFHDRKNTVAVLEKVVEWMDENGYTSECITKDMKTKTFKKIE